MSSSTAPIVDADGASSSTSTSRPWGSQAVLSKPLYVYQLPSELLESLQLRSIDVREADQSESKQNGSQSQSDKTSAPANGVPSQSGTCQVCPKAPQSRESGRIRSHLRSEWHRYNSALVKRGRQEDILREEAFNDLVEELSSGSSSDESETGGREVAPVDHVAVLLKRLNVSSTNNAESDSEDEGDAPRTGVVAKEPFLWFVTSPNSGLHIQQTQFGILRALFPESDTEVVPKYWHLSNLKEMQTSTLEDHQMAKNVKKFKGASAASEASAMLDAVFMDASGEKADAEDDSESESDAEAELSVEDNVATTSSTLNIPASVRSNTAALRTWTILLMAGGNFSAVIIALNPRVVTLSKKKDTTERQYFILARKQIHRYTTRRKQGGAQSLQDSSGKFAKSAGAQLRRYGEQALGEEIRALLSTKTWRDGIQSSDKIWIRAGLRSARGVLWSWQGAEESPLETLRKQDRVQTLPIATRKPTTGECLRCFAELTRVRVRHETEEELQARDALYRSQLQNNARARQERRNAEKAKIRKEAEMREQAVAAKKKAAGEKLDEKEILKRERLTRLIEIIRKGRIENTINHLSRYEPQLLNLKGWNEKFDDVEPDDVDEAMAQSQKRVNVILPYWWRYQDAREKGILLKQGDELTGVKAQLVPCTLLQVAAEGGHSNQVSYFLTERRSDPTISVLPPPRTNGKEDDAVALQQFPHRTAYDLCSTRDARDVFRRLMAAQPDWCLDWAGMDKGGARVSKALTNEMEEAREKEEKIRDKRQAMKDKARKRQEEEEVAKAHAIDVSNIEKAAALPPPPSSATKNRLGGNNTAPRALQRERDEAANLSPEVRARIEREKRARAAEARFKAMQSSSKS